MMQPIRPQDAGGVYRQQATQAAQAAQEALATPQRRARAASGDGSLRADRVQLSDRARTLARIGSAVSEADDVREGLVAELRARVEAGEYHVDATALARRLAGLGVGK